MHSIFEKIGILHQSSFPYTLQKNCVVEKKLKHILNVCRSIKFQSYLSIKFKGCSTKAIIYLINKLHSATLNNKSLYELLYLKRLMLSYIRVIGCLYCASILPRSERFSERSIPSILIGYSEVQKGYILLNISSMNFFVNRDVLFKENIFFFGEPSTCHTINADRSSILLRSPFGGWEN